RQIGTAQRRPQIGDRGAAAKAVTYGRLKAAESFLLLAIVIGRGLMPGRRTSGEPGLRQWIRIGCDADAERTITAAISISAPLPALLLAKIRQHVRVGPMRKPGLRPAIVIGAMTAHIGHAVD